MITVVPNTKLCTLGGIVGAKMDKCVYYCSTYCKAVRVGPGGGKQWKTCATRDYEPRPVWTSLPITH